jgi:hypothetical protein
MDEQSHELSAAGLSLRKTTSSLLSVLNESVFSIFTSTLDLGYFSWTPSGGYKKLYNVKSGDILKGIDYLGRPNQVLAINELCTKCPWKFSKSKSQSRKNVFPYDPSYLVPLHVAAKDRNVNLEKVDFLFGGSTLYMLATQNITSGCAFYAQLVPGTNILLVQKQQSYNQNLSDPGFQFERLVCGHYQQEDKGDYGTSHHLQILSIANRYKILVSAECDGVDKDNNPVEIKCKVKNKKTDEKTVFQMISSGSLSLYVGTKTKTAVTSIRSETLGSLIKSTIKSTNRAKQLERNLMTGLNNLREAVQAGALANGRVMILSFDGGRLKLNPFQLLPVESVVKDLLQTPAAPCTKLFSKESKLGIPKDEPDWERLSHLPDEVVVGMGYVPEDFCGFSSD